MTPLDIPWTMRVALLLACPMDTDLAEYVAAPAFLTVCGFPEGDGPPSMCRAAIPTFAAFCLISSTSTQWFLDQQATQPGYLNFFQN